MKHLAACLKRAQNGLAFAEVGEMLPGRDKNHVLAQSAPPPTVGVNRKAPEAKMRKQIGLGLGASLPRAVMTYVSSACQRMDADLNVLCTNASAASALLAPYREELERAAITCITMELDGNNEHSLMRYFNSNSRVIFVVSSGADDPIQLLIGSGNSRHTFGTAPVPIVVVASEQSMKP